MRMIAWYFFVLGIAADSGRACSCLNNLTPCGALSKTTVAVVGKVIRDSGEDPGTGPARIVVEEVLHGLRADVREIEVFTGAATTGAATSCYTRLHLGARYVLYGSIEKGLLFLDPCSGSFQLRGNDLLLAALRQAEAHGPSRLTGAVLVVKRKYETGDPAGAGVRVIAENGTRKLETRTVEGGQFAFTGIPPGKWRLRIDSPGLVQRFFESIESIRVPVGGCGSQVLEATQDGRIAGRVTDTEGKPIAGVQVQAFNFDQRGQIETSPFEEAKTDAAGRYEIRGLPTQEYAVGINGKKYDDEVAWPRVYYSGTADSATAKRVSVMGLQVTRGIDLTAGAARKRAEAILEVVDEEGNAVDDAGGKALDLTDVQRAFADKHSGPDGLVRLPLWVGESYRFEAYHIGEWREVRTRTGRVRSMHTERKGTAGPIRLDGPVKKIRVVLRPVER